MQGKHCSGRRLGGLIRRCTTKSHNLVHVEGDQEHDFGLIRRMQKLSSSGRAAQMEIAMLSAPNISERNIQEQRCFISLNCKPNAINSPNKTCNCTAIHHSPPPPPSPQSTPASKNPINSKHPACSLKSFQCLSFPSFSFRLIFQSPSSNSATSRPKTPVSGSAPRNSAFLLKRPRRWSCVSGSSGRRIYLLRRLMNDAVLLLLQRRDHCRRRRIYRLGKTFLCL